LAIYVFVISMDLPVPFKDNKFFVYWLILYKDKSDIWQRYLYTMEDLQYLWIQILILN